MLTQLPTSIYALGSSVRERLVGSELLQEFNERHRYSRSRFTLDAESFRYIMKEAVSCSPMNAQDNVLGVCNALYNSEISYSESRNEYHLPSASSFDQGSCVAIYNKGNERAFKVCFPVQSNNNNGMKLKPKFGVVLQSQVVTSESGNTYHEWNVVSRYITEDKSGSINPLVIDDPDSSCPGECYLTGPMVQRLLSELNQCYIHYPAALNETFLDNYVRQIIAEEGTINVLCPSDGTQHMVATRWIRRGDQVFIYLHETLGPDTEVSTDTLKRIKEAVSTYLPHLDVYLLTPSFTHQTDASACTYIAMEVFKAFDSGTNQLDDVIIDLALKEENCLSRASSTTRASRHKCNESNAINVAESESAFRLSWQNTPPVLLKDSQNPAVIAAVMNDILDNSESSLNQPFVMDGQKTTLLEYWRKHCRECSGECINLSALAGRYKAALDYMDLPKRKIKTEPRSQSRVKITAEKKVTSSTAPSGNARSLAKGQFKSPASESRKVSKRRHPEENGPASGSGQIPQKKSKYHAGKTSAKNKKERSKQESNQRVSSSVTAESLNQDQSQVGNVDSVMQQYQASMNQLNQKYQKAVTSITRYFQNQQANALASINENFNEFAEQLTRQFTETIKKLSRPSTTQDGEASTHKKQNSQSG